MTSIKGFTLASTKNSIQTFVGGSTLVSKIDSEVFVSSNSQNSFEASNAKLHIFKCLIVEFGPINDVKSAFVISSKPCGALLFAMIIL